MKDIIYIVITLVLLCFAAVKCAQYTEDRHTWQVELTYCNDKKDTVEIRCMGRAPSNTDIDAYRQAVPTAWFTDGQKFINVCNIKTLKQIK